MTSAPFAYRARPPRGFVAAIPGGDGVWHLGPGSIYAPLPHQIAHHATPACDVQVRVFAVPAAPPVAAAADPAGWAQAALAAVGEGLTVPAAPGLAIGEPATWRGPTAVADPAGLHVRIAVRLPTARGAIDRYACVVERADRVVVVTVQVTGARPVGRVAGWLATFCAEPFAVAGDPAWPFPPAPPLRPAPLPRVNQ